MGDREQCRWLAMQLGPMLAERVRSGDKIGAADVALFEALADRGGLLPFDRLGALLALRTLDKQQRQDLIDTLADKPAQPALPEAK